MQISDLLIKPVQRIMKYELLLDRIRNHTKRAGLMHEIHNLENAIFVMRVSMIRSSLWPPPNCFWLKKNE